MKKLIFLSLILASGTFARNASQAQKIDNLEAQLKSQTGIRISCSDDYTDKEARKCISYLEKSLEQLNGDLSYINDQHGIRTIFLNTRVRNFDVMLTGIIRLNPKRDINENLKAALEEAALNKDIKQREAEVTKLMGIKVNCHATFARKECLKGLELLKRSNLRVESSYVNQIRLDYFDGEVISSGSGAYLDVKYNQSARRVRRYIRKKLKDNSVVTERN